MTYLTQPDTVLYRTIPGADVQGGIVKSDAFMAKSAENYLMSTDQATLSTPERSFQRRVQTPALVQSITVGDVDDAARQVDGKTPVIDDHDSADPILEAHASIDYREVTERQRRRAAAAVLAERSNTVFP